MQLTTDGTVTREASSGEFIALVALTTSLVAMSIDTMLPALGDIARDLSLGNPNDRQLVLTAFFGGLSVGQLIAGPLSDATGRKPALFAGIACFIVGSLCCALAPSFNVLLVGRVLQGLGAAGPRIVAVAVVRDLYSGRAMAKVMSFVQTVFILVPVLAPAFGQTLLLVAHWRVLFWLLVVVALIDAAWFGLRQPETLPLARRASLSLGVVLGRMGEALRNRLTLCYTLASGAVFGAIVCYLGTSQQIYQEQYGVGKLFPVYFGACAFSLGLASFVNARLVMRFGIRTLSRRAVICEVVVAVASVLVAAAYHGHPPLPLFMLGMLVCFFCNGLLFGNYNARAMQPMGHIAGVAAAVCGSLSGLVAMLIGTPLGRAYDGTVIPVLGGFALLSLSAWLLTEIAEWGERPD